VSVGGRVNKGQVIARSGNTGRSFAPHLHYQLMQGSTVVDPFKSHRTERAQLPADERAAFEALVATQKSQLPSEPLAGN
jgi:murein DD-endopeptidase